jgi:predicted kinase
MSSLTIIRGVSGSGKSTTVNSWLRQGTHDISVSRDVIRESLGVVDERYVTEIEHGLIDHYLGRGLRVISDNTNIEWRFVRAIADIGYKHNADVDVAVLDVPLEDCISRNAQRSASGGRFVPEDVIKRQYSRFQNNKKLKLKKPEVLELERYTKPDNGNKAIIVDIDGTLAHMSGRSPFDWDRVGEDTVDEAVANIIRLAEQDGYVIIIMSGRDSVCRDETAGWLFDNNIPYNHLYMREKDDSRKDSIIKLELFNKFVRNMYKVDFVLDDRDQVVKLWRDLGLKCFQVDYGNF